MNRYLPTTFSAIFLLAVFFPFQVLAASITETKAAIGEGCVASGNYSTAMGAHTTASGDYSTAMGYGTRTAGAYSFVGGAGLSLAAEAEHTFVWGYCPSVLQPFFTANAFLIFPAGTEGRVGIGTPNPGSMLHIKGKGWPESFLFLDTHKDNQDSGIRFYENGNVQGHLFYDSINNVLRFEQEGLGGQLALWNNGNVGIGKTNPGQKLDIARGNGRVETGYNWLTNSDSRLKKNISTLEGSLEKLSRLRGVRFDSTKENSAQKSPGKHIGVIAQELEKEYPELVVGDEQSGYKAVAYDKLTAVLIEAVKELKTRNQAQEENLQQQRLQFQKQQTEIEELRSMIKALKS